MAYITVSDLRDEGVTERQASNSRCTKAISLAEKYILSITGFLFTPTAATFKLDGTGAPSIRLPQPPIAIDSIQFIDVDDAVLETLDPTSFRIYNDHLSQPGVNNPDERRRPRIVLVSSEGILSPAYDDISAFSFWQYFPPGRKNIKIVGTFGWTDYDPTEDPDNPGNLLYPYGVTPEEIKYVTTLLAFRYLPKLNDATAREDNERWRITAERTREQSYSRKVGGGIADENGGPFTGDPTIDDILARHMKVPEMESV